MKIYTNGAFLRPVNTSLHGYFTIENPSFSMYLLSTQEHTIPQYIKILQILFQLELSWFWIEGNGRFWDFLNFYVPLCIKKLSVQCVHVALPNRSVNQFKSAQQSRQQALWAYSPNINTVVLVQIQYQRSHACKKQSIWP